MYTEDLRQKHCQFFLGSLVDGVKSLFSAAPSASAGFGLGQLGSALNARRQWKYYKKQAALDHQYNIMTMDRAAEIAQDQYDYEYQMESPAARVAQLSMAGLNKGLMYSSGGQGMQGAVSSGSPLNSKGSMPIGGQSVDLSSSIAAVAQAKQVSINAKLADKDIALKDKELALKELERINKLIENEGNDEQLKILRAAKKDIIRKYALDAELAEKTSKKIDTEIENLDALTDKTVEETGLVRETISKTKSETERTKAETDLTREKINTERIQQTVLRMTARKLQAEIDRFAKQNDLSDAEIKTLNEQMKKYKEDAEYQSIINDSIETNGLNPAAGGMTGVVERFLIYMHKRTNSDRYEHPVK